MPGIEEAGVARTKAHFENRLPVGPPLDVEHAEIVAGEGAEETGAEVQVVHAAGGAGVGDGGDLLHTVVLDGDGLATVGRVVLLARDGDDPGVVGVVVAARAGVASLVEVGGMSGVLKRRANMEFKESVTDRWSGSAHSRDCTTHNITSGLDGGGEGHAREGGDSGDEGGGELHLENVKVSGGGLSEGDEGRKVV